MQQAPTDQTAAPVREIMSTDIATTNPNRPVLDFARELLARGLSGMPVVDTDGALVGMASEYDVISKRGDTVGEIMSRGVISVPDDAGSDQVAGLMGLHGIRRLPVVRDGRLVGIVSRTDLLRLFVARAETDRRTDGQTDRKESAVISRQSPGR
ncbi:MAG TPA: CBS domain-containing protein [Thermomicrobiales bacterium]|jgi:CBS domain-containing protein